MKINVSNYFEASKGVFKVVPASWAEKLVAAANCGQTRVKLGNREWKFNFHSSGNYGSESYYWVSADESWLIRVSDHWCQGPHGVRKCPRIRSCYWTLSKGAHAKCPGHGLIGGVVAFSDLKPNH